jgi:hypothetical protein
MSMWSTAGGDYGMTSMEASPGEHQPRTYVTEVSMPGTGDGGVQRLHSQMPESEPPATAADVLAVFRGEITGAAAATALASYFAPGPEPRYDTRQAQAEAEAGS